MKKHKYSLLTLLSIFGLTLFTIGEVVPYKLFSNNMVLQRNMKVPIWGTASPGEKVKIEFAGQKKETTAAQNGKWTIDLDPLDASAEGREMNISGVRISNILVGDVWLGSGQSNMWGVTRKYSGKDPSLAKAATSGPYPTIRLNMKGERWVEADKQYINGFSAIMFSFGHALHEELNIPIGLMVGAVGGTPSGRWLTQEMVGASDELIKKLGKATGFNSLDEMNAHDAKRKQEHDQQLKNAKEGNGKVKRFRPTVLIGDLYELRIEQYEGYGIRGVLWDQGESKTQLPGVDQFTTMNALISGWRKAWGQGDFHFLHVQKPSGAGCAWDPKNPLNKGSRPFSELPEKHINTKQALYPLSHVKMNTIKNAPLVTASDLAPGVHPPTKYAYGIRACKVALGTVYGRDIITCGPTYKSHAITANKVVIKFTKLGQGLAFRHANMLQGFEIAGKDGQWQWADAKIDGDTVIVSSKEIQQPVHVRYACGTKNISFANLFNKDGLPALMFTTEEH